MTGLELLRNEMISRGCTRAQAESKTVAVVLDIVANSGTMYTDTERLLSDIEHLEAYKRWTEREIREKQNQADRIIAEARQEEKRVREYIEKATKAMMECETQEGRDALRSAQMFVNSVDPQTKYDNTAFIIGLASILSRGNVAAIDELRKINPKIPKGVL